MTNENSVLIFYVNGKKVVEPSPDPEWTLLYYLRQKFYNVGNFNRSTVTSLQGEILARNVADNSFRVPRVRLPGTKLGCAEGGCGACTVMVSKYNRINEKIDHIAVNACLAPVCAMHGLAVTTTEGIGNIKTKLHPVQERIAKAHGSQCGFCTPGIVMSMYTLLRNKPKPTMHDLEVTFQGNLCRCTGYRPIIEGYRTFTTDWEKEQASNMINTNGCPMKDQCCKLKKENETNDEEKLFEVNEFTTYHPTQEPIFPSELKLHTDLDTQVLKFTGKEVKWFRPIKLKQLLELKTNYPNAKLIVGNTEVGVEVKFKKMFYPILIQTNYIPELTEITVSNAGVRVGSSVTLQEMETALKQQIKTKDLYKTRIFAAIVDMLHYFAGKQIRNVAAVGGNIMTSSPISDLNPIFLAANCILEVNSKARGFRKIKMDKDFFTGYRKNKIQSDEVLIAINIPYTEKNQYFYAYKQAKRRDDDIAIVNAAINVSFKENKISDIKLAFGGMAITTVTASKTEEALIGQKWDEQMLEKAYENLIKDLPLSPGAPGGMILYRRSLTLSLFFRVYLAILQQLDMNIPESYKSGITGFKYKVPKSSQYFQVVSNQKDTDLVGQPIVHRSAYKQASGEAIYCDDIPSPFGELYAGLVLSTKSHAEIISIDPSEALKYEGVHGFFYANDLTEHQNKFGMLSIDEEVFASKKVTSQGQIIAVVVAEDQLTAQKAARKIKVEYKDLSPVIITIEDAIQHNSYFKEYKMEVGKVDEAFKMSDHIIEGECRLGAQEHFYLETQCTLAIPKLEDDEMEIISSTQNPTEMAERVAHMLGIPLNRIVSKVKRLGGGFGGKESRSVTVALPIALAAYKLKRPVRCMLDRDEDMMITGQRHPFLMKYKTAFSKDGKITACEIYLYSNAGYSLDLSLGVMERAMLHFQNAYKIPNSRIYGYVCKTNLPSNTALRGFGGPQAMFAAENMIRDIAEFLDKDIIDIAKLNLYKEGDVTHYHQELTYCTLQRCWEECLLRSDYYNQKNEIEEFNKLNRWKKRGIAVVPTMYGIAFTVSFLNQAGALVHVYTDGTVLLTHGGVEMGQGLHTKMIQIASRVLGIPVENIYISETSTDKVPNTTPTAASSASDLNGMAVKNACEKINERLEPFKKKNPNGTFQDWAKAAFLNCVSLSATGYYNIQDIGYNIETNKGRAFNYFTYGVACSVVEVDCLTGDHQVLKTDIVMDLGESLNPAIDIGQVEGAFAQGYGLFTLEEMMYSPTGTIWTRGPGAYKLPGFTDIPIEFNVSLLKGAPNPRAVYSSKAVGEPPLFLSSSILFAIREAIKSARKDAGVKEHFRLNAPATSAKIRMGCIDHLTKKFEIPESGSYIPWNVDP